MGALVHSLPNKSSLTRVMQMAAAPMPIPILRKSPIHRHRPTTTTTVVRATSSVTAPQRRSNNYQPTEWDYGFLQSVDTHDKDVIHVKKHRHGLLKEEVRGLFQATTGVPDMLDLVDDLQQLGLGYHFQKEINDGLDFISRNKTELLMQGDVHTTAQLFRVFRENGFQISQDVFSKFSDGEGGFKGPHDSEGMLSLYEASFYAYKDESLLDAAREFTAKHLQDLKERTDPVLEERVRHALELPLNWNMPRLQVRWFIDMYSKQEGMNPTILELAKLDYIMVQNIHKKDLREAYRWWSELDLGVKLPFARDRIMDNFLWSIGLLPEPQYGYFRLCLTHACTMLTVIDDVYDVYGSMDELELFTDAIERWDVNAIEQLPDYMKTCFMALFNTVNCEAYKILKDKGVDVTVHLKDAWLEISKAFLVEAKWFYTKYTPTFEEYMNNATISVCGRLLVAYVYFFSSEEITDEVIKHLKTFPVMVWGSCMLFRLNNDMTTTSSEIERGDVMKSVECYMHQEKVSRSMAHECISKIIMETWKKMNKGRYEDDILPKSVIDASINLGRFTHWFYLNGDGPGEENKDQVMALLVESLSLE